MGLAQIREDRAEPVVFGKEHPIEMKEKNICRRHRQKYI